MIQHESITNPHNSRSMLQEPTFRRLFKISLFLALVLISVLLCISVCFNNFDKSPTINLYFAFTVPCDTMLNQAIAKSPGQAMILSFENQLDRSIAFLEILPFSMTCGDIESCLLNPLMEKCKSSEDSVITLFEFTSKMYRFWKWPNVQKNICHPTEFLNVYGSGLCSDGAAFFNRLCERSGFETRIWSLTGHVVSEVYYNDGWHLFDVQHGICVQDKIGVLSVREIQQHPEMIDEHQIPNFISRWAWKETILSESDNELTDWFTFTDSVVWRKISLFPGDKITFFIEPKRMGDFNSTSNLLNGLTYLVGSIIPGSAEDIMPYKVENYEMKGLLQ